MAALDKARAIEVLKAAPTTATELSEKIGCTRKVAHSVIYDLKVERHPVQARKSKMKPRENEYWIGERP